MCGDGRWRPPTASTVGASEAGVVSVRIVAICVLFVSLAVTFTSETTGGASAGRCKRGAVRELQGAGSRRRLDRLPRRGWRVSKRTSAVRTRVVDRTRERALVEVCRRPSRGYTPLSARTMVLLAVGWVVVFVALAFLPDDQAVGADVLLVLVTLVLVAYRLGQRRGAAR